MRLCSLSFKTHDFPHTVHYCCSFMPLLPETHWFLQSSSFLDARHALIGQLSSALWLAGYLKRETEMLRPLPYCDAMSRRDNTKTIKPITNKAFVASCGNIITDYKDLYCLFTFRVNITMSAFVIGETTNYKHYSTLLKTRVWIVSNRNVLTGWVRSTRLYLQQSLSKPALWTTLLPDSGNSPP